MSEHQRTADQRNVAWNAIYGLVGVLIGVLLSYYPTSLIDSRTKQLQLAALYNHLAIEAADISTSCKDHVADIKTESVAARKDPYGWHFAGIEPVRTTAWTDALGNGEFEAAVGPIGWSQLRQQYKSMTELNDGLQHYAQFTAFAYAEPLDKMNIKVFENKLNALTPWIIRKCTVVAANFDTLKPELERERDKRQRAADRITTGLDLLLWSALAILIFFLVWNVRVIRSIRRRTSH